MLDWLIVVGVAATHAATVWFQDRVSRKSFSKVSEHVCKQEYCCISLACSIASHNESSIFVMSPNQKHREKHFTLSVTFCIHTYIMNTALLRVCGRVYI